MKKYFSLLALTSLILFTGLSTGRAEVFVFGNQQDRVGVSYPDTWMRIHNQKPDDVLTVVAPGDGEFATCRVRVREDRRHLIYPPHLSAEVQRVAYSKEFWFDYMGEYDDSYIADVTYSFLYQAGSGRMRFRRLPILIRSMAQWSPEYGEYAAVLEREAKKQGCSPYQLHDSREWSEIEW